MLSQLAYATAPSSQLLASLHTLASSCFEAAALYGTVAPAAALYGSLNGVAICCAALLQIAFLCVKIAWYLAAQTLEGETALAACQWG